MNRNKEKWPFNSLFFVSIFVITVLVYAAVLLYIVFADISIGKIFYIKLLFESLIPATFSMLILFGRNDLTKVSRYVHILLIVVTLPFICFSADLPKLLSDLKYLNNPKEIVLSYTILRNESNKYMFDGLDENKEQQIFYFRFSQSFWRKAIGFEKVNNDERIKKNVVRLWHFTHGTCKNPIEIQYFPNSRVIINVREVKNIVVTK